jgi:hypothetical protein
MTIVRLHPTSYTCVVSAGGGWDLKCCLPDVDGLTGFRIGISDCRVVIGLVRSYEL